MQDFTPLNLFGEDEESKPEAPKEETPTPVEQPPVEQPPVVETPVEEPPVVETPVEEPPVVETPVEEPPVEQPPQPDKLDKVLETQQQMLERLEALSAQFSARIMYTDHEEKIVDQMHKELQKYKEDMYAQLVRPILMDVIAVRDSIMRMAATYLAKPEGEQSIPNKTFADYAYDLQDILEKNAIEIYRSKTGDAFTPIRQRVIKKISTPEEALHGKVAESMTCGYSYNGRVISPEKIAVYNYEKPVEENNNSEVNENG